MNEPSQSQRPRDILQFAEEREKLNETLFKYAGLTVKRFFGLDHQVYKDGALPAKIKELLGLTASIVLRCDDCIDYHLIRCHQEGVSDAELEEALSIALIVGGSVTIPHLRKAFKAWDDLKKRSVKV
ncbi:MAG: carboxymuconolactone decarboxylase family protein [candidate division Zixibacteria bacterium]|nr:carboxymuconolactone decarboxylase family protein [Candidatus Tariuqbacter arcticus]